MPPIPTGHRFFCHACRSHVILRDPELLICPSCTSDFLELETDVQPTEAPFQSSDINWFVRQIEETFSNLRRTERSSSPTNSSSSPNTTTTSSASSPPPPPPPPSSSSTTSSSTSPTTSHSPSSDSQRPTSFTSSSGNEAEIHIDQIFLSPFTEHARPNTTGFRLNPTGEPRRTNQSPIEMFFGVSNINFPAGGQSAGNQANPFDHIFQGIMNYFGGPTGGLGGILGDYVFGQEQFDQIISQLMEQNQSNRPTPASESFISNLPDVEIIEPQVAKGMDCAVCQEKFNLNEVVTKLTCDHLFHRECIVPWLKTNATCPTCRFVLEPAATSSTTSSSTPRRSTPSTNSASTSTHNSAMNSGNEPSSSMPGSWPPVEGLD